MVDSVYSPVKDVGYKVEYTRVGDITNYEKLTVNIETDGTITPEASVEQATQILIDHFSTILGSLKDKASDDVSEEAVVAEEPKEEVVAEPVAEEAEEKPKKKSTKKEKK